MNAICSAEIERRSRDASVFNDAPGDESPGYAQVVAAATRAHRQALPLDITCGSGTTAVVAEQWGRRWMTCDTSRVALTLAKQRLMTAVFDYYQLAQPDEGIGSGLRYKTVPHVTLKSIANHEPPGWIGRRRSR